MIVDPWTPHIPGSKVLLGDNQWAPIVNNSRSSSRYHLKMPATLDGIDAEDGAVVDPKFIPTALTAGKFQFEDGATQEFNSDGTTTYTERGQPSEGTWYVQGHLFCSFWPPSYTGCYLVSWLVEAGRISGLRFADQNSPSEFVARYTA